MNVPWLQVLLAAGVKPSVASAWAIVMQASIKEKTFSRGILDVRDFLATILHESTMLTKLKEDGYYSAKRIRELGAKSPAGSRWRSLVPIADQIEFNEAKFFEACYGGRMGNGPVGTGDGAKFPGRGPIGVTGKTNYLFMGELMGQDLTVNPTLLEGPYYGLESAILWWENKVPDTILGEQRSIRRVVNGGYFGVEEVEKLASRIYKAIG